MRDATTFNSFSGYFMTRGTYGGNILSFLALGMHSRRHEGERERVGQIQRERDIGGEYSNHCVVSNQ